MASVRVASSLCPPEAAVFVLESDKLPNGGREGWGVDQGLSFHSWPIITLFTVPSLGTTCRHFPGWWLQGPWAVSNDNSGKGHREVPALPSPPLPTQCLEPSPALGASVRDTSASPGEMEAEIWFSMAEAGADPASNPQPPWAPGPSCGLSSCPQPCLEL